MKNAVILMGSPHKNGNSAILANAFAEGFAANGNAIEIISLSEKSIAYCIGCDHCRSHGGECIQHDDMVEIANKIENADVVIFATPLYFLTFSAQTKTCIDRLYGMYHAGRLKSEKTTGLIVVSGGPSEASSESLYATFDANAKMLGWANGGHFHTGGHGVDGKILESDAPEAARKFGASFA